MTFSWGASRSGVVCGAVCACLVLYWGTRLPAEFAWDDAFITYRYAANLSRGLGLTYNPGQWVLGTTTPLYAILLGILGVVHSDFELLGRWVGIVSWIAASWFAIALFHKLRRPTAGLIAGILFAMQPSFLASLGMETPLLIALMLAVATFWYDGKKRLTAALIAALLMTRLDSALWLLLLGLEMWRRDRRPPIVQALLGGALFMPWLIYAQWRYGSFLPNSIAAKIDQTVLMPVAGQGSFVQNYWSSSTAALSSIAITVFALSILVGLTNILRRERRLWWLVAWPALYFGVYSWLGTVTFPWYYAPPAAILALISALGIASLFARSSNQSLLDGHRRVLHLGQLGATALVFVIMLAGLRYQLLQVTNRDTPGYQEAYRPAALWLSQSTSRQSVVASIEIGVIGYLSNRPILDTMGLISPTMTDHLVGWQETLAYAIAMHWPDYALTVSNTAWDSIVPQWWFSQAYEAVRRFDTVTVYRLIEPPGHAHTVSASARYLGGINLKGARISSLQLEPGMTFDLQLQLETPNRLDVSPLLTLYLVDSETDERLAISTMEPFGGSYPFGAWQPGDSLLVPARIDIPMTLEPGTYRIGLLLYDPERERSVPFVTSPEDEFTEVQIGWLRSGSPSYPLIESSLINNKLGTRWEKGVELVEIALPETVSSTETVLPVRLSWRSSASIDRDLTVFVHLLDDNGVIIAQQDQRPHNGRFPTPSWQIGETITDLYQVILPADIPADTYGLRIGLYDSEGRLGLAAGKADSLELPGMVRLVRR